MTTWDLPALPEADTVEVWDRYGAQWDRYSREMWAHYGEGLTFMNWRNLLYERGPVTDTPPSQEWKAGQVITPDDDITDLPDQTIAISRTGVGTFAYQWDELSQEWHRMNEKVTPLSGKRPPLHIVWTPEEDQP